MAEAVVGSVTKKRQVVGVYEKDGVVLRELDGVEVCKGAPVMEAFPIVGVTGVLAAQYIIDQLSLPLVGVVDPSDGTPTAVVMKSQPGPAIRLYGNDKLVVWISETKLTDKTTRAIVQMILSFAERHESSAIYCVEGVPTQESVVKRTKMNFLTTDEGVAKILQELGHEFTDEAVISGITGGLVAESPFIKGNLTCLLCPASAFFPDASTSLELVKILMQLVPGMQNVDTSPLQDKASFLEDKVKKILKLSNSGGGPPAGMFG